VRLSRIENEELRIEKGGANFSILNSQFFIPETADQKEKGEVQRKVALARHWRKWCAPERGLSGHTTPFPGLLFGFGEWRGELALTAPFLFR